MNIVILVEDKVKNPGIAEGIAYYQTLCSSWAMVSVETISNRFKTSKKRHISGNPSAIMTLKPTDYLVALDREHGDGVSWSPDSREFSEFLGDIMHGAWHCLMFAVGGAEGFSTDILSSAQRVLHLSRLTFPHDLVPLILMEQIYRSFTILHRHPYHR